MQNQEKIPGTVTVDPEVLETVARLTTLEVPGVEAIAEGDVERILGSGKSVMVRLREGRVLVDVHIIAGPDRSLLQLGRKVQFEVTRAIQRTVGMPVDMVNVHIEDVIYPAAASKQPAD